MPADRNTVTPLSTSTGYLQRILSMSCTGADARFPEHGPLKEATSKTRVFATGPGPRLSNRSSLGPNGFANSSPAVLHRYKDSGSKGRHLPPGASGRMPPCDRRLRLSFLIPKASAMERPQAIRSYVKRFVGWPVDAFTPCLT